MSAARIAVAGLIALAVAMGIGRFAFTPILPMMLHDRVVDLPAASWLASANYIGYLSGAAACTLQPMLWARLGWRPVDAPALVRTGLVGTGVLTLAMALPIDAAWAALRFAAGLASALVFVYSSGWCLAQLANLGRASLGGLMFAGPGAGIVASGLLASALVAADRRATDAWLLFGAAACLLTAFVWRTFRTPARVAAADGVAPLAAGAAPVAVSVAPVARAHGRAEVATLAIAYGVSGFGYIVTATFLPVIARTALPAGSPWLDLFWPIFGAGIIVGALLATRVRVSGDLRLVIAAAYVVQAIAIAIGVGAPTTAGFAISSFMLGAPFTAITYFALQEVRRLRPAQIAATTGLVTVTWSIGQAAGPPMVALALRHASGIEVAFTRSLAIAAAMLVAGALIFLASSRIWPRQRRVPAAA
ncbi:MAG TPA: YbfB/YjiJ family MFS transporter [Caldimonas sp.]|nr:YbfB/YjiJ family MFS transporter [Caldimonas sp.]HEX4236027.1 YbfB/YjiJ family MFS transporter [Caldimonas sp.]